MNRYCNIDIILQLYLELSIKRSIRREKHQGSENMKVFLIEFCRDDEEFA